MTEWRSGNYAKSQTYWIMCLTCRQHTNYGNIAHVDDRLTNSRDSQSCTDSEASIRVNGSYSMKIEAVTRRILGINSKDPSAKIIVFTSWNDVLDVLEHAFTANNIRYVRMKGGRKSHVAISLFRGQNNSSKEVIPKNGNHSETNTIQVILILIQHGSSGLNLLEAQYVILVEPLLNPTAEAQAVRRVHQIGQQKETYVHRFIVKNSVEESIYKMNKSRNDGSFISGNRKNQDQLILTLSDVKSLFRVEPSYTMDEEEKHAGSLMYSPPSVAAAIAAERRLMENPVAKV